MDDIIYRGSDVVYRNNNELVHYGVSIEDGAPGRGSGRYPKGSGENPYQHDPVYNFTNGMTRSDFLTYVKALQADPNLTNNEIALMLGMTRTDKNGEVVGDTSALNNRLAYLREEQRNVTLSEVQAIRDAHPEAANSATELGKLLAEARGEDKPVAESTIRGYLKKIDEDDNMKIANTAKVLAEEVANHKIIDIGLGVSTQMGITDTKMKAAIQKLVDEEGYSVHNLQIQQASDSLAYTDIKVLAAPGMEWKDVYAARDSLANQIIEKKTDDDGMTYSALGIRPPTSVDSKRIAVVYGDEGGTDKDGVIELRPGVEDLSLGGAQYAQVRIAVDGTHYMKGMAVYNPDLPDGVDIRFNTNKPSGTPWLGAKNDESVFKNMKSDPSNPFGSMLQTKDGVVIGQRDYVDSKTGETKLSPINVCKDEGDWENWSKTLPSQFLSKQSEQLARRQLQLDYDQRADEFEEIKALTNPEVKASLLAEFADNCDAAAVNLKASAMPRQSTKVILPITSLKDDEIYAPTYKDGEELILVRFPHAGTFEIPTVHVNNKNKEGKKILGNNQDAVGINAHVAARLSGADFDGDTVMVIPTAGQKLKTSDPLPGLRNFSTDQYRFPDDNHPEVGKSKAAGGDGFNKGKEMGVISNLITDMTLRNASLPELERAVKHSMVVIDAEKHQLNWKQSEKDNNIKELKQIYQQKTDDGKYGGASTLISRAKGDTRVNHRREVWSTSNMTPEELEAYKRGEIVYRDSGKVSKMTGKLIRPKSTQMAEAKDARELISRDQTAMEVIYANYANSMKQMANDARKELRFNTGSTKVNPQAKQVYSKEVVSLNAKINNALSHKPDERAAQALSSYTIAMQKASHPEKKGPNGWDKEWLKKVKNQSLNEARRRVGTNKKDRKIDITDKEWEAIQSGAISSSKINTILANSDKDRLRQLATPRKENTISSTKIARIQHLIAADPNATYAEIADQVGVSASTVAKYAKS